MLFFSITFGKLKEKTYLCRQIKTGNMTEETLVISNPSSELLRALAELRKHKLEKLERLRKMKPEDFSRRVILS